MNCSVNLVPTKRLEAAERRRRRRQWGYVHLSSAVAIIIVACATMVLRNATAGMDDKVQTAGVQQAELQRRLVGAAAEREQILDELRVISSARRPQPWARRLLTLARHAPDSVFLTTLRLEPPRPNVQSAGPKPSTPPGDTSAGKTPTPEANTPPPRQEQAVRMTGYAVDHASLISFVNELEAQPDWEAVKLVRAVQEARGGMAAVSFELSCRTLEPQP